MVSVVLCISRSLYLCEPVNVTELQGSSQIDGQMQMPNANVLLLSLT